LENSGASRAEFGPGAPRAASAAPRQDKAGNAGRDTRAEERRGLQPMYSDPHIRIQMARPPIQDGTSGLETGVTMLSRCAWIGQIQDYPGTQEAHCDG